MTTLSRLATAWMIGIALAAWRAPPLVMLAAVSGALVGALVLRRADPRARLLLGTALCVALGALRFVGAQPDVGPDHIAALNDAGVATFRGRIAAEPDRRDRRTDYRVAVADVREGGRWRAAGGLVLVQASRFPRHAYGEDLIVTGTLESPPVFEGFDYRRWLAHKDIHTIARRPSMETIACCGGNPVRRGLVSLKDHARGVIAASLPEPEASLATGILLGDARGIPDRVDAAFRATNTTHVIAISGSNVAILVALLMTLLVPLVGRRRAVPIALLVLGLYTALVGADAAVVRAAVMGGVMLLGSYLGRPGHAVTALMAAAWAMTAYRPGYLWDLGFQLSFAATIGLVLFADRFAGGASGLLERTFGAGRARDTVRLLNEAVLITLAAQVTTWPIIAHHVGQVSTIGLAANFLIVPAQSAVMVLGGLMVLVGAVWPTAGRVLGAVAWLPIAYTIRVVETAARVPAASLTWSMPALWVAAYFALLGAWVHPGFRAAITSAPRRARTCVRQGVERARSRGTSGMTPGGDRRGWIHHPRWPWLALAGAGTLCALVWVGALSQPDGLLHLIALDVGQGDALLVIAPNGRRMLVDGGPSPSAVLDGLGRRFAPWDRRLDVVVLTHADADHVGGLPAVLERYDVGLIAAGATHADTADAQAWRASLGGEGAEVVRAASGTRITLDDAAGVVATVLWPPDPPMTGTEADGNNNSVVLRLTYGRVTALLTGDIEAVAESALMASGAPLSATVLKVAHHGGATSTTEGFVRAVSPWVAVIGVGADNNFGHPAPDVLARLAPAPVYRTDTHGAVELLTDGQAVWVR